MKNGAEAPSNNLAGLRAANRANDKLCSLHHHIQGNDCAGDRQDGQRHIREADAGRQLDDRRRADSLSASYNECRINGRADEKCRDKTVLPAAMRTRLPDAYCGLKQAMPEIMQCFHSVFSFLHTNMDDLAHDQPEQFQ